MKTTTIYAALDLHSTHSLLGSIDHDGNSLGRVRFATGADTLKEHVTRLGCKGVRPRGDVAREVQLRTEDAGQQQP